MPFTQRTFLRFLISCFFLGTLNAFPLLEENSDYKLEKIYSGEKLWSLAFLNEQTLLATEFKTGKLRLLKISHDRILESKEIPLNLELETRGQAGLFDLILHPNFASNQQIYFTYARKIGNSSSLVLARGEWTGTSLENIKILLETPPKSSTIHYSGVIAFDKKGSLYLSSGERGEQTEAQNKNSLFGKILRLKENGDRPMDNPFKGIPPTSLIYALGVRNAQGLIWDDAIGSLWETEHGPQGGDELNEILAGENYGWPLVTYGEEYGGGKIGVSYHKDMKSPIYHYTPSPALSSLLIYRGDSLPIFRNKILIASLKAQTLFVLDFDWKEKQVIRSTPLFTGKMGRIRNIKSSPEGWIYLLSDEGEIFRLKKP